jgi:hypothetical protein
VHSKILKLESYLNVIKHNFFNILLKKFDLAQLKQDTVHCCKPTFLFFNIFIIELERPFSFYLSEDKADSSKASH